MTLPHSPQLERGSTTLLHPVSFELCHLQKFSDDTAIVRCVEGAGEEEYKGLTESFDRWCGVNHLQLNVSKTMETV